MAASLMAACARQPSQPKEFWEYCSEEQQDFSDRIEEEVPVTFVYHRLHETAEQFETTDSQVIAEIIHEFGEITVEARSEWLSTDNDNVLEFTMGDGTVYVFFFNGYNFQADDGEFYELSGDEALWSHVNAIAADEDEKE